MPALFGFRTWLHSRRALLVNFFICSIASATTVVPPSIEELVGESDYVIHGTVTAVSSNWQQRGGSRVIVTKVSVEVIEVIIGPPPGPLVLTMLGGRVGSQTMLVEGAPEFEVGDEDILFIAGNGRNVSPIARIMYGRFRIEDSGDGGRRVVLRNNGEPLSRTSDISKSLHREDDSATTGQAAALLSPVALGPDEFIRQIKTVKPVISSYE